MHHNGITSDSNLSSFTLIAILIRTSKLTGIEQRKFVHSDFMLTSIFDNAIQTALTLQRVFQRRMQKGSGGPIEQTQPKKATWGLKTVILS